MDSRVRPPVMYHLSDKQLKELLVRKTQLEIALPAPPHDVDDPADWARSVLPQELRALVTAAEEVELHVDAIRGGNTDALTSHLGNIVDPADRYVQCVVAIVVTLRPPGCRHQSKSGPKWPKEVVYRGQRLP